MQSLNKTLEINAVVIAYKGRCFCVWRNTTALQWIPAAWQPQLQVEKLPDNPAKVSPEFLKFIGVPVFIFSQFRIAVVIKHEAAFLPVNKVTLCFII